MNFSRLDCRDFVVVVVVAVVVVIVVVWFCLLVGIRFKFIFGSENRKKAEKVLS